MDWVKLTEGIRYRKHPTRKAVKKGIKKDRYFAIYYRIGGVQKNEGLGWESQGWSEDKAKMLYSELKQNRKTGIGPKTYKEKREIEKQRDAEEKAIAEQTEARSTTVSDYFNEQYIKLAEINKSAGTVRREKALFEHYIKPVIGDVSLSEVNKGHVEEIKAAAIELEKNKKIAKATVNLILATIRQILNLAIDKDIISMNPVSKVKMLKFDNKRVRFLTEEEAENLLATLKAKSEDTYRIALFSLHMGLRAGEIFNLTWADINVENGTVFIKDTKTDYNRHAYITDRVREEIKSMTRGVGNDLVFPPRGYAKVQHMQTISKTFMRAVDELKLNKGVTDPRQKIVFHSLRHTFASWHVQKGVSLYVVKELLGHKTLAVTERYSHNDPERVRQATAILDSKNKVIPLTRSKENN